ncbi:hypothetical protein [Jatrophihabitans sp.]|uniref:hypothetical protein n=1 Tax=Jatrophihabitans sp. TaxID=1932789 RepID=UPI0030C66C3B|nr:hypothetical protein [Jatrophihabitans sp.]
MAARTTKVVLALAVVAAIGIGAVVGIRALFSVAKHNLAYSYCDVGAYELDTGQTSVAAQMVGEVSRFTPALPERAAVLVLAAALQESKLTNLASGDRDSVGVLQQRPSQGWGNPAGNAASLRNVTEATREFLVKLVGIDGWQKLAVADAVQRVQISADGSLYGQYEDEAKTLADTLQGHTGPTLTCTIAKPTAVATAATVVTELRAQLPVNTPTALGKTISVPGAAWQTASWFVANADRLGIDQVSYDGHTWSRQHQWKTSTAPKTAVVATLATV